MILGISYTDHIINHDDNNTEELPWETFAETFVASQNPLFTYTKIQLFLTPRFSQLIMSEILLKFVQCSNSSYLSC